MTGNNLSKKSCELKLLQRYQRNLLLGGGLLLSLAFISGVCFAIWSDIQDYIAEGRAMYVANKALISQEIEKKQAAMQRGVVYSELLWGATGSTEATKKFGTGRMTIQSSHDVVPQLLLGAVTPGSSVNKFARLLAFSEAQSYAITASARERGESFCGFFFDPEHTFISIAAPPKHGGLDHLTSQEIPALIARLAPDMGNLSDSDYLAMLHRTRRVFWLPPAPDKLTGETSVQVAAPGFEGDKPFAIFVSSLSLDVFTKWLKKYHYAGNFMIIDQNGKLILNAWDQEPADPGLTEKVLSSGSWRENLDSPDYVRHGGVFTFSERLSDTGWVFTYAYSWRTILAARGNFAMAYLAGTLFLLGLLWTLIWFCQKEVLAPLLLRSQRVFDSEKLNRAIITTAPNGLCLISEISGKTLMQNDVMRAYDCGDTALSGRFLQIAQQARVAEPDSGAFVAAQDLTVTSGDENRHLLVNLVRTRYQGESMLLCSFSDITERKQLERNLREARAASETANQAKSAFLATMSHEIRTPLNGILGNLELLAHTSLTELQQDRLRTISSSSRTLLEIINDILDFSKIESGQMSLEEIDFDAFDLLEQTISIFVPMAVGKGLNLFYRIEPTLPRLQVGDPTRLRQIIVNLLSNAIKFTGHGKVGIEMKSEGGESGDEAAMILRVMDTGTGISAEHRKELFRPFQQGDASIARRYGGTGLGLALCKRLVQLMGGSIDVESAEGQGSVFTVRLPLRAAQVAPTVTPGGVIGVLCESAEWRSQLLPQLKSWGMEVKQITSPVAWTRGSGPLLLFGAPRSWPVKDEERIARNVQIIDAQENGPRQPVVQGKRILVSCYSTQGLQRALYLAANPLRVDAAIDQLATCPLPVSDFYRIKALRVLVVEDHPVNLSLIGDQLRVLGYDASLASSVGDGLQLFNQHDFDIVLTDLSMQGIDGYMFARMLRGQGARLPIVAITAHASQEDRQHCRDAGIDGVLLKPMSLHEIDETMRRHLKSQRPAALNLPAEGKPVLSEKLIFILRESSETSLEKMREAGTAKRHQTVLEHLHSIKGAFAMQHQERVVAACKALERDCETDIPDNFLHRLEQLDGVIHEVLAHIGKAYH